MVQACNPSTEEVESGESSAQGYPELHSEPEVNLSNIGPEGESEVNAKGGGEQSKALQWLL